MRLPTCILVCAAAATAALSAQAAGAAPVVTMTGKDGSRQVIDQAPDPDKALVDQAVDALHRKNAAGALAVLDRVIADEDARHADEKRLIFCARSTEEAILYAGMAASLKRDAVILDENWAMAIYLKGYALIDLDRGAEAKPLLERAVSLAPMNAQFLGELGQWHQSRREWDDAYAVFQRASGAAEFSPDEDKSMQKRRALRGMGYVLTEQGRFDDAERMYRECLKIDPNDEKAKGELGYIREQRAKLNSPRS